MTKKKQATPFPLRIDENLMDKVKALAAEEGRSVNKQIEFIIKAFFMRKK